MALVMTTMRMMEKEEPEDKILTMTNYLNWRKQRQNHQTTQHEEEKCHETLRNEKKIEWFVCVKRIENDSFINWELTYTLNGNWKCHICTVLILSYLW